MDDMLGSGGGSSFDMEGFAKSMETSLNKAFKNIIAIMKEGFKDANDINFDAFLKLEAAEADSQKKKIDNDKKRADFLAEAIKDEYARRAEAEGKIWQEMTAQEQEAFKQREEHNVRIQAERIATAQYVHQLEEQLQKKREDDRKKFEDNFEVRKARSLEYAQKYEEDLHNQYVKAKEANLDKALREEAARRGKTVAELNEAELDNAKKVADKRMASEEEFVKNKKKDDAKKNKEKTPTPIDMSSKNPIVGFKNAFTGTLGAAGAAVKSKMSSLVSTSVGEDGKKHTDISGLVNGIADFAKSLDNKIDASGKHQTGIDTRLYGSTSNDQAAGSYWKSLSNDIMGIAGASPIILQTDMIASLEKLVSSGISHNVKLRAFLDTVTNKIATTFEVNDSTMLRLIRMQQQDTTAARMGMESALNAFLNNMFETTEYLSKLADSVRGNLEEAQALMGAKDATEFEYQVQKWLGSFYSVGMSDSAVTNISTTLGQLAAGQIEALSGSGTGNLMIMAANEAGISIADILKDGLNADTTNKLMQAMVDYLAQIATQSDSKVIQQQLAGVFGMKASDVQSVLNLVSDNSKTVKNIANSNLTNEGMMLELITRAATMSTRVSMGEMMSNLWENVQVSMATGIANNPAMYGLYKMAGLLQNTVGGIPISFANIYGFGIDLNTSVAQLMQAGALAGGIISSLPQMISGLANAVGGGAAMLATAGITTQGKTIHRGDGGGIGKLSLSGASTSSSGLVGNGSTEDMTGATMSSGQDDIDAQGTQGKEENEDATRDDIIEILKMLFGMIGEKLDENTLAVKGQGGIFNSNNTGVGGFTNASTTINSVV